MANNMFDSKTMGHTGMSLYLIGHMNEMLRKRGTFQLRGEGLNIADVFFLSENPSIDIHIGDEVCDLLTENRKYLMDLVNKGLTIYGVNTGFGGSADVRSSDTAGMQRALLRLLNAGFGPCFDSKTVRAAMAIRANCLCRGYSGVRPELVLQIIKLLNHNIIPKVPIRGSISASGDLMPLSYVAAAVAGRPDLMVDHKGESRSMEFVMQSCDIEPLPLQAKEGLAIMNSVSFSTAVSAKTTYHANIATLLTQVCSALCFEAMHGKVDVLDPLIHQIKPHAGQIEVAENMRMLLEGSEMVNTEKEYFKDCQTHCLAQDRYDLRTVPQWIGPVLECLSDVIKTINTELISVDDNPIVDHRTGAILSGGNFQGTALMCGMDRLRSALQLCGKLLLAQLYELVNPAMNKGLTPNLSGQDVRTDFGFKGVDIAMAAYMSELEHLGNTVSNHVQSAEMNNQSVNSLALISGRLTTQAVEIVQSMISMHLLAVVQAVDLRWLADKICKEVMGNIESKLDQAFIQNLKWFNVAFETPVAGEAEFSDEMKRMRVNGRELLHTVETSPDTVATSLGKGTRDLYLFVRQTMDIPFHHGQYYLDTALEKILKAIQNGHMNDVILQIMSGGKDLSCEPMLQDTPEQFMSCIQGKLKIEKKVYHSPNHSKNIRTL